MAKSRRITIFIFMFLIVVSAIFAQKTKVVYRETSYDFGKIKAGNVVSYEFVFRNEGPEPLVIDNVESSCGCTAAILSDRKINPGKEGRIKVSFDSRGLQGKVIKFVYVNSNDAEASSRELSITAEIEPERAGPRIEINNYNVDLGLSLEGESPSFKIVIKNVGQKELKTDISHPEITFLESGKPVKFPLFVAAGKSKEIEFRFNSQTRTGLLRDYILIKSNDELRSTLSVYVSRYVLSRDELKKLFEKYRDILSDKE